MLDVVCGNGHDLTVESAWVYSARGFRSCRLCAEPKPRETGSINRWDG